MQNKTNGLKVIRKLLSLVKPLSKYMVIAVTAGVISFLFYTAISVLAANLIVEYIDGGNNIARII